MLSPTDVPEPWEVVASPIPPDDATALDHAAGFETDMTRAQVSWDMIRNTETGRSVLLRMAADESGLPIVSGVYVAPAETGGVAIVEVRNLPLASIEAAARNRWATFIARTRAAIKAGPEPLEGPLGRPSGPDDHEFYARLAVRYVHASSRSQRPATDIAEREGVTARTVQRWVSRAREVGYLPAGRPGRAS